MSKIKTELASSGDEEGDLFDTKIYSNFPEIKIEYSEDIQNIDSKEGLRALVDSKQDNVVKSEPGTSKKDIASTLFTEIDIEYSDVKDECDNNASGI